MRSAKRDGYGRSSPDVNLTAGIADRDGRALAELYSRYSAYVWRVAYRATDRSYAADEITGEVFLTVWRRPGRYDPTRGSMRAWLATVAEHCASAWLRHELAVRRRALAAVARENDLRARAGDPVRTPSQQQQAFAALEALPATECDAITLARFGGRTCRQVSVDLGITEGEAKAHLRSGLTHLASIMNHVDHNDRPGHDDDGMRHERLTDNARSTREARFERCDRVDGRTLQIRGPIEHAAIDQLDTELALVVTEAHSPAFVDLSAVTFLDTGAARSLVNAARAGAALGHPIVLVSTSQACRRTLEAVGEWEFLLSRD